MHLTSWEFGNLEGGRGGSGRQVEPVQLHVSVLLSNFFKVIFGI